ncbi:hypothetical protein [Arthrobacter sp. Z4-13]
MTEGPVAAGAAAAPGDMAAAASTAVRADVETMVRQRRRRVRVIRKPH